MVVVIVIGFIFLAPWVALAICYNLALWEGLGGSLLVFGMAWMGYRS